MCFLLKPRKRPLRRKKGRRRGRRARKPANHEVADCFRSSLDSAFFVHHNHFGDGIMVTARSAFESLRGKQLTYEQLRQELRQFWSDNLEKLPSEFSTRELFALASRKGWIHQDASGMIRITLENRSSHSARTRAR